MRGRRKRVLKKRRPRYGLTWGQSKLYYKPGSHTPTHMMGHSGSEELKFIDRELVTEAMAVAWTNHDPTTVDCLSAVATGDGESDRDGRVYYIHSVDINGRVGFTVQESVGAPVADPIYRIIVVVDKQTNGALLTPTDVMDASLAEDFHAFRNLHFSQRFWVLKDIMFSITMNTQTNEGSVNLFANGGRVRLWNCSYVFKTPLKVFCSLTTAVIAAIENYSIHVIAICSTTNTTISYQSRVRFTE